ncbi:MAG TPA: ABC transporter C-terminal domain-containing protein [Rhodanobacter sp.]|nr:ABC transporter C-terminal domain-containing protein [Rhodanobacter sp.]
MRKQLLITGLCCGLALVPTRAVLAQTTNQTDHQRIEALEARVAALEQRLSMPPVTSASASHQAAVAPAPQAPAQVLPAAVAAAAPTAGDWSQLHQGMDPREVTAQIGPPDHKQVRPMSEIWFYPDNRQLSFDNNGRLDSWSKP